MFIVRMNRATTVLRPFEANFNHTALNKILKFFAALCVMLTAGIVILK